MRYIVFLIFIFGLMYPASYFKNPAAMGMGGASAAMIGNVYGIYGNPAAVFKERETYDFFAAGRTGGTQVVSVGIADSLVSPVNALIKYNAYVKKNVRSSHEFTLGFGYTIASMFSLLLEGTYYQGPIFTHPDHLWSFSPAGLLKTKKINYGFYVKDFLNTKDLILEPVLYQGLSAGFGSNHLSLDYNLYFQTNLAAVTHQEVSLGTSIRVHKHAGIKLGYRLNWDTSGLEDNALSFGFDIYSPYQDLYVGNEINFSRRSYLLALSYRFIARDRSREDYF